MNGSKWEFDESVADVFDDMLEKSIPQYEVMRNAVFNIGCKFLSNHKNKTVLDLGCSNGIALDGYVRKYGALGRFKGVEISKPMADKAKERFSGYIKTGIVQIDEMDLRNDFPMDCYTVIQSILTIQFIPIEYRQGIIQNVYNHLCSEGVFIMVEKVLGNCHILNEVMVDEYLKLKEKNGYSRDEIERKRLALEGVLVPVTSNWNVDLLKQAGFKSIDVFWRWMNFEGYIAIKGGD